MSNVSGLQCRHSLQPLKPAETETDPQSPAGHLKARGRLAAGDRWIPLATSSGRMLPRVIPNTRNDPTQNSLAKSRSLLDKKPQEFLLSVVHFGNPHPSTTTTTSSLSRDSRSLRLGNHSTQLISPGVFLSIPQSSLPLIAMASPAQSTGSAKVDAVVQNAAAGAPGQLSGLQLYSRFALAGAVCCSITHGALTPVDVYVHYP